MANKIVLGNYTFTDSDLLSGNILMEHSAVGETLTTDTLIFVVRSFDTGDAGLFTKFLEWYHTVNDEGFVIERDNIEDVAYATPVYYYIDDVLRGKFFVSEITRKGATEYQFKCTSAIGLLSTSRHLGGIYSGITAATLIADILDGVTYTLDAALAGASIRGYLPVESKAEALQQVLFAIQGAVKIEADGTLTIVQMTGNPTSSVDASVIYLEDNETRKGKTVDGVQLTEHNYFQGGENETLFDDSISGVQLITFSDPHYNISAVNGGGTNILVSSGANYAIVGSEGVAQACVITGNKYIHVERIVSAGNVSVTGSENIARVPGAYLANPEIAEDLADIVWNYAQCNKRIFASTVVGNEKPGDVVEIVDPYSFMSTTALLTSMNIDMSKTNKSKSEFLVGYTPASVVSGFKHYVLLTGKGAWTASGGDITVTPITGKVIIDGTEYTTAQTLHDDDYDIDKIRFILVGGGSGGGKGENGGAGGDSMWNVSTSTDYNYTFPSGAYANAGAGGQGGNGGKGGQGGRIFELSLDVASGDSGTYESGIGGNAGSDPDDTPSGTESTFTLDTDSYTSESGRYFKNGYIESKSGLTFANAGVLGSSGGDGGNGGSNTQGGSMGGTKGEDIEGYIGGSGAPATMGGASDGNPAVYYSGGGGSGATGTSNGNSASTGGNGASAPSVSARSNATNYGGGGDGGYGGAGGGGGAGYYSQWRTVSIGNNYYYYRFGNGVGGAGSNGGNGGGGANGCILFYW